MLNIYTAHEIGPVLAFGAALAGRVLGGRVLARRRRRPAADGGGRGTATDVPRPADRAGAAGGPRPARPGPARACCCCPRWPSCWPATR